MYIRYLKTAVYNKKHIHCVLPFLRVERSQVKMAAVSMDHFPQKSPLRSAKKLPSKAEFELVNLKGKTGEIFIAIAETTAPMQTNIITPPKARVVGDPRSTSPFAKTPLESRAASPSQKSNSYRSHTSSPTLVRSSSNGSTATHSPIMRSMFPRFDPSLPLAQQKYYPNMERIPKVPTWTHDTFTRPEYSPSLYSESGSPGLSAKDRLKQKKSGITLGEASVSSLASQQLDRPILSTPEELLDLWSIANGQGGPSTVEKYTLGLHWYLSPSTPSFLGQPADTLQPFKNHHPPHLFNLSHIHP